MARTSPSRRCMAGECGLSSRPTAFTNTVRPSFSVHRAAGPGENPPCRFSAATSASTGDDIDLLANIGGNGCPRRTHPVTADLRPAHPEIEAHPSTPCGHDFGALRWIRSSHAGLRRCSTAQGIHHGERTPRRLCEGSRPPVRRRRDARRPTRWQRLDRGQFDRVRPGISNLGGGWTRHADRRCLPRTRAGRRQDRIGRVVQRCRVPPSCHGSPCQSECRHVRGCHQGRGGRSTPTDRPIRVAVRVQRRFAHAGTSDDGGEAAFRNQADRHAVRHAVARHRHQAAPHGRHRRRRRQGDRRHRRRHGWRRLHPLVRSSQIRGHARTRRPRLRLFLHRAGDDLAHLPRWHDRSGEARHGGAHRPRECHVRSGRRWRGVGVGQQGDRHAGIERDAPRSRSTSASCSA